MVVVVVVVVVVVGASVLFPELSVSVVFSVACLFLRKLSSSDPRDSNLMAITVVPAKPELNKVSLPDKTAFVCKAKSNYSRQRH